MSSQPPPSLLPPSGSPAVDPAGDPAVDPAGNPAVDHAGNPGSATLSWGVAALWEQLAPLLPGLSIEVLRTVASTNSVLLERASVRPDERRGNALVRRSVESAAFGRRAADLQPSLLVAEQQSAGRGRQGRSWQSVAGASLTFSLGVPLALTDWSGLSLAVGVALCEALDPIASSSSSSSSSTATATTTTTTGPRLGLKWPNDLWLIDANANADGSAGVGRKLGGVLIETVAAATQRLGVIGIGLNVLAFDASAADLSSGFGAVCELDPAATAPAVLARVALPLVRALQQFEREGFAAFAERFAARDLLFGRAVTTTRADLPHGIARGVSAQGALRVETPAGDIIDVVSGEVSVRLDGPTPSC